MLLSIFCLPEQPKMMHNQTGGFDPLGEGEKTTKQYQAVGKLRAKAALMIKMIVWPTP